MLERYSSELLTIEPFRRIRHIPGQPVTYLQNPKVACTSIELMLWRAYDADGVPRNPHGTKDRPFIRKARNVTDQEIDSLLGSTFFSVVRNPFARLLSAYLNKVGSARHPWERICRSFGLAPDSDPSLRELLSVLNDCDPYRVDHHFRPQHVNLLHGLAPLDFIGHMERMDEVRGFLEGHGFAVERYDRHATNAASLIGDFIGPHEAQIIRSFYAQDFEIYGYSEDAEHLLPVRQASPVYSSRAPLRQLLRERQRPRPKLRAGIEKRLKRMVAYVS